MLANAEVDFGNLERFATDGEFFWGLTPSSLRSRTWQLAIAFDAVDLLKVGRGNRQYRQVKDVQKGLASFPNAPDVDDEHDVDLWRYRTYRERYYVEGLCALTTEQLQGLAGRYDVHAYAVYWDRVF